MFPQPPDTASAPRLGLDLALTARCPLRCRFCSVSKAPVPELSALEWRRVLSDFARLRAIGLVSLEGGEPLTRRDLPEILAASLELAAEVKLVTSGALPLTALPVELVRHPAFTLEVSVDGPPAVHDFLRDGSWRAAWRFIRRALDQGVRLRLRSVLSCVNRDCLEAWLADVDRELAGNGAPIGYRFDVLILPETLQRFGGPLERHGLRAFDGSASADPGSATACGRSTAAGRCPPRPKSSRSTNACGSGASSGCAWIRASRSAGAARAGSRRSPSTPRGCFPSAARCRADSAPSGRFQWRNVSRSWTSACAACPAGAASICRRRAATGAGRARNAAWSGTGRRPTARPCCTPRMRAAAFQIDLCGDSR